MSVGQHNDRTADAGTAGGFTPGVWPVAQAWYLRTWRGFCMDVPQRHDRMEWMYVLSGTCQIGAGTHPAARPDGADWVSHAMRRGDFLVVNAGIPHTLVTDPDSDCRMLNVEYAFADCRSDHPDLLTQTGAVKELAALFAAAPAMQFLKDSQDIGALLRGLVLELDGGAASGEWLVQSLFSALHVRLARLWAEQERFLEDASERYVSQACQLMRARYGEDLRIPDIAAQINVHPAYLQRLFRKRRGMTMVAYLNRYRMEQARMLLLTTDLPVADLCGYVGFSSRQHFSALFRNMIGESPAAYRRNAMASHTVGEGMSEYRTL